MKKNFIIAMFVVLCSSVFAFEFGLNSISAKAGMSMPENLDTTFYLGADANIGSIMDNLDLVPFVGFWSSGKDELGGDWTYSDFQFGANAIYGIDSVEGMYAGGGLSFNIFTFSWDYTLYGQTVDGSDSETKIGFDVLAGYEMEIAGKTGFAEVKYDLVEDFNTLEILVGLRFDFTK